MTHSSLEISLRELYYFLFRFGYGGDVMDRLDQMREAESELIHQTFFRDSPIAGMLNIMEKDFMEYPLWVEKANELFERGLPPVSSIFFLVDENTGERVAN